MPGRGRLKVRAYIVVAENELRQLRHELVAIVILFFVPLIVIWAAAPALNVAYCPSQAPTCDGHQAAVGGLTVLFVFLAVSTVGFSYYHEFEWGTWPRLRVAGLKLHQLIVGKSLPLFAFVLAQQLALLIVGGLEYRALDLRAILSVLPVAVALGVLVVALGTLIVTITRSIRQVNAVATLGAMVLGGLGGALSPQRLLPGWARDIGRITPSYWAVRGYADGLAYHDAAGVWGSAAVVLGISAVVAVMSWACRSGVAGRV